MKKCYLALILGMITACSQAQFIDWRTYLPTKDSLKCRVAAGMASAAKSYLFTVNASLAISGDPEAIEAFQELLTLFTPSELICLMGASSLDEFALELSKILPTIPGISKSARAALEAALYYALKPFDDILG